MQSWRMRLRRAACLACIALVLTACSGGDGDVDPAITGETLPLPTPRLRGDVSLEVALQARRSVREFTSVPLTDTEISQLLWAAQGITGGGGRGRTSPSAGGLYPLELSVATAEGVFHYDPTGHALVALTNDDLREALFRVALRQDAVQDAPAVFAVSAVFERTAGKYGDRAARYVHLEAGHAAQNLLLQAVALGLGGVPIGAFDDGGVQRVLGLPADYEPLYLIPIGHPTG